MVWLFTPQRTLFAAHLFLSNCDLNFLQNCVILCSTAIRYLGIAKLIGSLSDEG